LREHKLCIAGGFYACPDTNMVSGEALFRNLLYGTRYFKERFSHDVTTGSLHGPSGWSAQVPQMLKLLGIERVAGRPMHGMRLESPDGATVENASAFLWEGLDGSAVPVYMPTIEIGPTRFYPQPFQETFRTKESFDLLNIYKEIIGEAQQHEAEVLWVDIWDEERKLDEELVDAIWEERRRKHPKQMLFAEPANYDGIDSRPPEAVHRGEINPIHTGTFSTRIGVKQASVMLENLIVDVEKWFAAAAVERLHFPELKFHDLWEQVFILQSHHAISGCHTDRVRHRLDSLVNYTRRELDGLKTRALSAISSQINAPRREEWRPLHVFNSLNWQRTGIVEMKMPGGAQIADGEGNPVPLLNRGDNCIFLAEAPACGYSTYWFIPGGGLSPQQVEQDEFETDSLKVDINRADGNISITDKKNQVVVTGESELWGGIIAREDRGSLSEEPCSDGNSNAPAA